MLAESVAGELISSEIEIRSGRGETFAEAIARQRDARARLFELADRDGVLLGATGTSSQPRRSTTPGGRMRHARRATPASCAVLPEQ
ncbi:MAG: hypothetical protein ACRDPC_08315 [Solirubrobacteraceae bacterium]